MLLVDARSLQHRERMMNESTSQPVHLAGGMPASAHDFILRRRERVVRAAVPLEGRALLDFGCGNGEQTRSFVRDFPLVVGADVGLRFLRVFRDRMRSEEVPGVVAALRYDGRRLPLANHSVDRVVSVEVLEHVEDESAALSEIARVLAPGGWLAMSVPNRWWIFETHGAKLPLLPWNRVPFFSWLPKSLHDRWARARIYRRRDIVSLLEEHGLEVQESGYITAPMDVVRWAPLRDLLRATVFGRDRTSIPFLATAVFVTARKPD